MRRKGTSAFGLRKQPLKFPVLGDSGHSRRTASEAADASRLGPIAGTRNRRSRARRTVEDASRNLFPTAFARNGRAKARKTGSDGAPARFDEDRRASARKTLSYVAAAAICCTHADFRVHAALVSGAHSAGAWAQRPVAGTSPPWRVRAASPSPSRRAAVPLPSRRRRNRTSASTSSTFAQRQPLFRHPPPAVSRRPTPRHRSEQYSTCSQSRAHFFRHANGRPQAAQTLVGRCCFLCAIPIQRRNGAKRLSASAPAPRPNNRRSRARPCARTSPPRHISPAAARGGTWGRPSPRTARA